ncbi:MAG TPA: TIGR03435 family protein [Bryobacteraceae bacterium]|nr:TIGR03435 family protein [Bryobacteraceae bacterium]
MRFPPACPKVVVLLCTVNVIDTRAQWPMEFEVASVKLNNSGTTTMKFPAPAEGRFQATNFPLKALVAFAWDVLGSRISGAPDWTNSERFDVDARAADTRSTREQYQQMLRSLLEERFRLTVHMETKDLPAYELLLSKTGSRLKAADPQACQPEKGVACGSFFTGQSSLDGRSMSMAQFCNALGIVPGRPVADHTGLGGRFDIHLEFDPEGVNPGNGSSGLSAAADSSAGTQPSIFSALQQQLGLKLQSHKEPTEVLVIDRLERLPTGN